MRIVDLTAPIQPSAPGAPELMRVEIDYYDHTSGAQEVEALFGLPPELLRNGEGWAREDDRRAAARVVLRPGRPARLHRPRRRRADHGRGDGGCRAGRGPRARGGPHRRRPHGP